jgi:formylglycine-generating enzyme required for sulfatase activity
MNLIQPCWHLLFVVALNVVFPSNTKKCVNKNYIETVNGYSFKMIYVEGGSFEMDNWSGDYYVGTYQVDVEPFYIGETEVTQSLWEKVMGTNPAYNKECPECPIENVSWISIQKFIKKLNKITGKTYSLPMEYQWEYAAVGGKELKGYILTERALEDDMRLSTYSEPSIYGKKGTTIHVKLGSVNELGMYGLNTNVFEACFDWYREDYSKKPFVENKYIKSVRGVSFQIYPPVKISRARWHTEISDKNPWIGFRLCLTPASSQAKGRTKELFHDTQEPAFWK